MQDASVKETKNGRPNPLRRLYHWVLHWAETPYAVPALFLLALVESSVFPLPPDVLLLVMGLSLPNKALRYAAVCTIGSLIGGALGYSIGYAFWGSLQDIFIPKLFSQARFDQVMGIYRDQAFEWVFISAFTPIPYKVFTIAAGVAKVNLGEFLLASAVGRAARFFLVGFVIMRLGERARPLIERHFNKLTIVLGVLVVGLVYALKTLR